VVSLDDQVDLLDLLSLLQALLVLQLQLLLHQGLLLGGLVHRRVLIRQVQAQVGGLHVAYGVVHRCVACTGHCAVDGSIESSVNTAIVGDADIRVCHGPIGVHHVDSVLSHLLLEFQAQLLLGQPGLLDLFDNLHSLRRQLSSEEGFESMDVLVVLGRIY